MCFPLAETTKECTKKLVLFANIWYLNVSINNFSNIPLISLLLYKYMQY